MPRKNVSKKWRTDGLEERAYGMDSSGLAWASLRQSIAGVPVTSMSALGIPAFAQGIKLITENIAKTPLFPARRNPRGGYTPAIDHPTYRLLRNSPNNYQTATTFWTVLMTHALIAGQGIAEIKRVKGRVTGFHLLDPSIKPTVEGDRIFYKVGDKKIDSRDVISILGLSWDGIDGLSIIDLANDMLGTRIAETKHQAAVLGNGAVPNGYVTIPGNSTPESRAELRHDVTAMHGGAGNAGKFGVFWGGAEFHQTSMSPADTQLIESQNFGVAEVARILNIPCAMFSAVDAAKPSSTEEMMSLFVAMTLSFWFRRIQNELDFKLLTLAEQDDLYFWHDTRKLTQGDSRTQVDEADKLIKIGVLSENEARLSLGMNPIDDERFDFHLIPTNNLEPLEWLVKGEATQPAVNKGPAAPKPDAEAKAIRSNQGLIALTVTRMAKAEAETLRRAAKKPDFHEVAAGLLAKNADKLADALDEINPLLEIPLDGRSIARKVADEALGELRSLWTTFPPEEMPAKVDEVLSRWISQRGNDVASKALGKLTLALDFNGVIHDHVRSSGGKGPILPDAPEIPGAIDFLKRAVDHFNVQIMSARFNRDGEAAFVEARAWLVAHDIPDGWITDDPDMSGRIVLSGRKGKYLVSLDDRAINFDGSFPDLDELAAFKPWNAQS